MAPPQRVRSTAADHPTPLPAPSAHSTTNLIRPLPKCRERGQRSQVRRRQIAQSPVLGRLLSFVLCYSLFLKAVFQQDLDRAHAVAPADLLALRAAARLETNRQLENRVAGPEQLGGDLGLDVESV